MNFRKSAISIVIIIILVFVSFAIYNILIASKEDPTVREKEELILEVFAEPVKYSTNSTRISNTGRLSSQNAVGLSVEVTGKLLPGKVKLKEGTNFNEGDLLVRVFDEEARANLKASKTRFLNSIAGILPDMKIDFPESYQKWMDFFDNIDINKPLPELPSIPSGKEKVFLASRNILNDYYTIESLQIRLSKYHIYAPFTGSYSSVNMEIGSIVSPGTPIATMIRTNKMELVVPVKIDDIYFVQKGDKVDAYTKDGIRHWRGEVIRKSDHIDPNSQSINVFVELQSTPENTLYQGQYLKAVFDEKELPNTMKIPRNAIFSKNMVYIIDNEKLKKASANIVRQDETNAFINGLEEGIYVITEPVVAAQEGIKTRIINK